MGSRCTCVAARAGDHDSPLLEPTLAGICDMIASLPDQPGMHLDRGYDSAKTRDLLQVLGYQDHIATKGVPAPIQASKRWPVQCCHAWLNGYGKLRRCTDKRKIIVEFYLYLAAALTVIRRLINRARTLYRWPSRPTARPDGSADGHLPVALRGRSVSRAVRRVRVALQRLPHRPRQRRRARQPALVRYLRPSPPTRLPGYLLQRLH